MILTVNIGNTHITVGGYEQDTLIFCGRLHSDPAATVEEYAIRLVNLLQLYRASPAQIEGGILGSVVPMLSGRVLAALQLLCKARILTVGPGLKSGIKLRLDNPAQLGAELLCGAVAALAECPGPLVVISADTAISLMAVNAKQELVGGVILPGPQLSMNALVQKTAQLPQIDPATRAPDSVLGKSTAACLQNGFVLGTASLLDGLADRYRFYVENHADRAVIDAAYAACWRRYLFLCAKVRQYPTPELVKAISKEQFLMQGLISYLPNCRNMKMTEKLSAARWSMMSAQSLCPIK
mgnify:CR=1 FL=1